MAAKASNLVPLSSDLRPLGNILYFPLPVMDHEKQRMLNLSESKVLLCRPTLNNFTRNSRIEFTSHPV